MPMLARDLFDDELRATYGPELVGAAMTDIIVHPGASLRLTGTVERNVTVRRGGSLFLDGVLVGVLSCAGRAEICGVLKGPLYIEDDGVVVAATGAGRIVDGARLVLDETGQWIPHDGEPVAITDDSPRWSVPGD